MLDFKSKKELKLKEKKNGNQKQLNIHLELYGNIHNLLVLHLKVLLLTLGHLKKKNATQIFKNEN